MGALTSIGSVAKPEEKPASTKGNAMKRIVIAALVLSAMLLNVQILAAQQPATGVDQDIRLLRKDLQSARKQIVAANVPLTDTQAEKFWPVYEQYTAEMMKINDTRVAAIKDYAASYEKLTDAQAHDLMQRSAATDQALAKLRTKYIPIFEKVLPGKTVARFFQVDRRIGTIMDVQLASEIPLVEP